MSVLPSQVVRISYGKGRYRGDGDTGEGDFLLGTYDSWSGARTDAVVWCHGDRGTEAASSLQMYAFWKGLALHYTLSSALLGGGVTFGNNNAVNATDDLVDYLAGGSIFPAQTEPVIFVCASMGFCTATNYALRFPARVKAIAGIIPATDIDYLHTNGAAPLPADIDFAYPPSGWSQATFGADRNPVTFAPDLPADLPIKLWYAPDDSRIPPSLPLAYQAARPQTELELLPPGDHTDQSVLNSLKSVLLWLAAL